MKKFYDITSKLLLVVAAIFIILTIVIYFTAVEANPNNIDYTVVIVDQVFFGIFSIFSLVLGCFFYWKHSTLE